MLQSINDLAQEIGLSGTPGVIVMPTTGATEASITVFPGLADKASLEAAIKKPAANPRRITCPGPPTAALLSCVIALFLRRR